MQVLRALGQIESRMAVMQQELAGTTQCSWLLGLEGRLSLAALSASLRRLFGRYQALRCAIADLGEGWAFVEHGDVARLDLRARALPPGESWRPWCRAQMQEELNRPLDAAFALGRVLLLDAPEADASALVVTLHHAIIDGAAAGRLLQELLEGAAGPADGGAMPAAEVPLGAPLDRYLRGGAPASGPPGPRAAIPFMEYAPLAERRTAMHCGGLTREQHRALAERASRDRVSVSSIVAAAMLRAADRCGIARGAVPVKTAVSLRHLVPDEQLGCYITVCDADLEAGASALPELAGRYDSTLMKDVYERGIRRSEVPAGALKAWTGKLQESRAFADGVGVTMPGPVTLARRYDGLRLVDYQACANRNAGNGAFVLSALSFDGELTLALTFTEPLMKEAAMAALNRSIEDELIGYAES